MHELKILSISSKKRRNHKCFSLIFAGELLARKPGICSSPSNLSFSHSFQLLLPQIHRNGVGNHTPIIKADRKFSVCLSPVLFPESEVVTFLFFCDNPGATKWGRSNDLQSLWGGRRSIGEKALGTQRVPPVLLTRPLVTFPDGGCLFFSRLSTQVFL